MIDEQTENGMVLHIPKVLMNYKYIQTIGSGAFSVVVLFQSVKTNELFACKVVSRKELIAENGINRFEQETRIQQCINHPNIIKIFEIVYQEELIFVIMEYCSNGELFKYVADHPRISSLIVQQIFMQTTSAVAFLHSRGIVHRDIKPENILLTGDLTAKLADFGFSKEEHFGYLLSTPCGSTYYAAPEILSGKIYDGEKADIWSLGVVLYCLSTGTLPWTEEHPALVTKQITSFQFMVPSFLTKEIRDTISQCMNPNPMSRPTADQLLCGEYIGSLYRHSIKSKAIEACRTKNLLELQDAKRKSFLIRPTPQSNGVPGQYRMNRELLKKSFCAKKPEFSLKNDKRE